MRPSQLQKLVKKYDGSMDPHDHVASFRQVLGAERVSDSHTQIEGFGLTLEGKAQSWFQTLEPCMKTSFLNVEKNFVAAFSKIGPKHSVAKQIDAFSKKRVN